MNVTFAAKYISSENKSYSLTDIEMDVLYSSIKSKYFFTQKIFSKEYNGNIMFMFSFECILKEKSEGQLLEIVNLCLAFMH